MNTVNDHKIVGKPLDVIVMGDPRLHQKASKVSDPTSIATKQIVADMIATLDKLKDQGISGLAAPQVAIMQRVIVFQVTAEKAQGGEVVPLTVLINPELLTHNVDKQTADEPICISMPGVDGKFARYSEVTYRYQTVTGEVKRCHATGFHARLVQHAVDHLNGILYTD